MLDVYLASLQNSPIPFGILLTEKITIFDFHRYCL